MSTAELRLCLIERITQANEETLLKLIGLLNAEDKDWWNNLSEEDKASVERGLQQADKGNFVSHDDAMKVFDKWK